MPRWILNIDLGELPDEPDELYALAHVANVACGGHAGDEDSIRHALARCARYGTGVGAHPSYPDREGFGRRPMQLAADALRATVAEQCERIAALCEPSGLRPAWVKPHGALYHAANRDPALAHAVVAGAVEALGYELSVLGPADGALERATHEAGVGFLREGFADRGTGPDGALLPRGTPGALLEAPAEAEAQAYALCLRGDVDTLCVHGDTPGAVAIARRVRALLDRLNAGHTP